MDIKYNFDVVIAYQENISTNLQTSKHILVDYLLKKNLKILYIEYPRPIHKWLRSQISKIANKNTKYQNYYLNNRLRVIRPISLIPTKYIFDKKFFCELESNFVYLYLLVALKVTKFSCKTFLIYLPNAITLSKKYMIKNQKKIYHLIDDFRYLTRAPKCFDFYHKQAIKLSDFVITPSEVLSKKLDQKKCVLINHGFKKYNKISSNNTYEKYINNHKKNILYYGQLDKINFKFSIEVIKHLIDFNFLFVGEGEIRNKEIRNIDNAYILNSIQHDKLIDLFLDCQLLWCPFSLNKLTNAMTPIKFIEALSLGKPVLSTKITFKDSQIKKLIKFSNSTKEHINYIENLQNTENQVKIKERKASVEERNWDAIMGKYFKLII